MIDRPEGPAGWSALEAIAARRADRLSAVDWIEAAFARIEARAPTVRAWANLTRAAALEEARRHDGEGPAGRPLAGLPIGVKDDPSPAGDRLFPAAAFAERALEPFRNALFGRTP